MRVLKTLALIVGLLFVEQFIVGTLALYILLPVDAIGDFLLMLLQLGLIVGAMIYGYKSKRLTFKLKDFFQWKTLGIVLLGYLGIFAVNLLGTWILGLEGATDTVNQATIEDLFSKVPVLTMFLVTVVVAPLCEELIFRSLFADLITGKWAWLGLVLGSLAFAGIHLASSLGEWLVYGGMGAVLSLIYWKTKRLDYAILVHLLNNLIAFIVMLYHLG